MNFSLSEIPGFRADFLPAYTNPEVAAGPRRTAATLAPMLEAVAAPAEPREFEPILDTSYTDRAVEGMKDAAGTVVRASKSAFVGGVQQVHDTIGFPFRLAKSAEYVFQNRFELNKDGKQLVYDLGQLDPVMPGIDAGARRNTPAGRLADTIAVHLIANPGHEDGQSYMTGSGTRDSIMFAPALVGSAYAAVKQKDWRVVPETWAVAGKLGDTAGAYEQDSLLAKVAEGVASPAEYALAEAVIAEDIASDAHSRAAKAINETKYNAVLFDTDRTAGKVAQLTDVAESFYKVRKDRRVAQLAQQTDKNVSVGVSTAVSAARNTVAGGMELFGRHLSPAGLLYDVSFGTVPNAFDEFIPQAQLDVTKEKAIAQISKKRAVSTELLRRSREDLSAPRAIPFDERMFVPYIPPQK